MTASSKVFRSKSSPVRGFRNLVFTLLAFLPHSSFAQDLQIFNWSARNSGGFWRPVTDSVRGGASTAFMEVFQDDGYALISGELRLNSNQAGFASYRLDGRWDLSQFSTLEFSNLGDGREYKILLKDNSPQAEGAEVGSFQLSFATSTARQVTVLRLADVQYVVRGRAVTPPRPLDLSQITEIGIQINDSAEGPYAIKVFSLIAR
jgi:hypothetical protein